MIWSNSSAPSLLTLDSSMGRAMMKCSVSLFLSSIWVFRSLAVRTWTTKHLKWNREIRPRREDPPVLVFTYILIQLLLLSVYYTSLRRRIMECVFTRLPVPLPTGGCASAACRMVHTISSIRALSCLSDSTEGSREEKWEWSSPSVSCAVIFGLKWNSWL